MTPRWAKGTPTTTDPGRDEAGAPAVGEVEHPAVERVRPRLWPLVPERAPALSVVRTARQAARQHPDGQGLVIAFSGSPADHLDVWVDGSARVQLTGGRERPVFVAVEPGLWAIRAGVGGATGYKHFTRYDVAIEGARHRQIELLWFRVERFQLSCDITTIRPGTGHPSWDRDDTPVGAR